MMEPKVSDKEIIKKAEELLMDGRLTMLELQKAVGLKPHVHHGVETATNRAKKIILGALEKRPALMEKIKTRKMKNLTEYHEFFLRVPHDVALETALAEIERNPGGTYMQLAEKMMLSDSAVTALVRELAARGYKRAQYFERTAPRRRWGCDLSTASAPKIKDPAKFVLSRALKNMSRASIERALIRRGYSKSGASMAITKATRGEDFLRLSKKDQKRIYGRIRWRYKRP